MPMLPSVQWGRSLFQLCAFPDSKSNSPSVPHSINFNINGTFYMISMAFGTACNTRISNALGAGVATAARKSFIAAVSIVIAMQIGFSAGLYLLREHVAMVFTNDAPVVDMVTSLIPIVCGTIVGDGESEVLFCIRFERLLLLPLFLSLRHERRVFWRAARLREAEHRRLHEPGRVVVLGGASCGVPRPAPRNGHSRLLDSALWWVEYAGQSACSCRKSSRS